LPSWEKKDKAVINATGKMFKKASVKGNPERKPKKITKKKK